MPEQSNSALYLPFLGILVAFSVILVGTLLALQIQQFSHKYRAKAERHRRGSPGLTVLVRGLGVRSEASLAMPTAPQKLWATLEENVPKFDSASPRLSLRGGRLSKPNNIFLATHQPMDLSFLSSAGRG